jgi:hypothetical protein
MPCRGCFQVDRLWCLRRLVRELVAIDRIMDTDGGRAAAADTGAKNGEFCEMMPSVLAMLGENGGLSWLLHSKISRRGSSCRNTSQVTGMTHMLIEGREEACICYLFVPSRPRRNRKRSADLRLYQCIPMFNVLTHNRILLRVVHAVIKHVCRYHARHQWRTNERKGNAECATLGITCE